MDPNLKAYLDDVQRANSERFSALAQRLEAVQGRRDEPFRTALQRSDAQFEALRAEMQKMYRHNRTLHEATQRARSARSPRATG